MVGRPLRATLFIHTRTGKIYTAMLTLQINGKQKLFPPDIDVAGLVTTMALAGKRFAIELNGEIVPKSCHATTRLRDGDQLEVVVAVGGG